MKHRFVAVCYLLAFVPGKQLLAQQAGTKPVAKQLEFKIIQYLPDETIWRVSNKIITAASNLTDIYFYAKNFNCPYSLPPKFANPKFKNATDTVWSNPKAEKTSYQNKRYTYSYDSLARLVKYVYSGCLVCSNLPYTYHVNYDKQGRVSEIINANPMQPSFRIQYDANAGIRQIDQLVEGKLSRRVVRIK